MNPDTTTNITPSPGPGPVPPSMISSASPRRSRRLVDLGREGSMVPWAEWFHRASHGMDIFVQQGVMPAMPRTFRVTLVDGRAFAVFSVKTHIAKGKCSTDGGESWHEPCAETAGAEVCDVITGYSLVGTADDGRPSVLAVPPTEISSVECVLVEGAGVMEGANGDAENEDDSTFGFAAFAKGKGQPELTEEDEPTPFSSVI